MKAPRIVSSSHTSSHPTSQLSSEPVPISDRLYNGWTNYETWAVKLWLDNDHGTYLHWQEQSREHWQQADSPTRPHYFTRKQQATYSLADALKSDHEENNPLEDHCTVYTDLLRAALSEVNWREIAEAFLEDFEEAESEVKP